MIEDIEIEWFATGMRRTREGVCEVAVPVWELRYRLVVDGEPGDWRIVEKMGSDPHSHTI